MSRIGKMPIPIEKGVTVTLDGNSLTAKGPKGEMTVPFSEKMQVTIDGGAVHVKPSVDEKGIGALWGLTRSLLYNAVTGVFKEWEKILEVRGVGYRAALKGKDLDLNIGQSHPMIIPAPDGITFTVATEAVEGQNIPVITVKGVNRQAVGDISADIRAKRPPEPYKGKGIRYRGEYVRRKAGKATG